MSLESHIQVKRRVMVVDDSRAMRAILRRALEELGFQVSEAAHGKEALERLAQLRIPHLALLDWNMPEMNGLELLTELRRDQSYDQMAVMMVTSESEPAQVERALRAGANEYIMKPFSPDVLAEKLVLLGLDGNQP